jgi:FAD/FMN-containing dehydrogenase
VLDDIARALAFGRREGLHVALRSGGHCSAGRSSTTDIVIDVSGIDDVSVSDGTVAIGAGARPGDVYDALATHDRRGLRANGRDRRSYPRRWPRLQALPPMELAGESL